jgi:hypothetical protein
LGILIAPGEPNMFRSTDKLNFKRAKEVGFRVLVGFLMLGAGATLSPASISGIRLEDMLEPKNQQITGTLTLPELSLPWLYSIAVGFGLLILARRKAQL